ncbi:MAG: DUF4924 family protein [Flavobacteriales bacterium]|nr:DUF4924 family protein [Flavobacteriales bacterium]
MLIAQHKKRTNIAEYILYMWQIEDVIRSHNFDLTQINDSIIEKFEVEQEVKYDIKLWYQNLIEQMMKEGIAEKGHLSAVKKYSDELNNLHNSLLTTIQDTKYQEIYIKSKDSINAMMIKSGGEATNEIEACLIGLYGYLMLKLKQTDISKETQTSIQLFSQLIALLVDKYNKLLKGELQLSKEKNN